MSRYVCLAIISLWYHVLKHLTKRSCIYCGKRDLLVAIIVLAPIARFTFFSKLELNFIKNWSPSPYGTEKKNKNKKLLKLASKCCHCLLCRRQYYVYIHYESVIGLKGYQYLFLIKMDV